MKGYKETRQGGDKVKGERIGGGRTKEELRGESKKRRRERRTGEETRSQSTNVSAPLVFLLSHSLFLFYFT